MYRLQRDPATELDELLIILGTIHTAKKVKDSQKHYTRASVSLIVCQIKREGKSCGQETVQNEQTILLTNGNATWCNFILLDLKHTR